MTIGYDLMSRCEQKIISDSGVVRIELRPYFAGARPGALSVLENF